jgi:hypothetical protein
MFTCGRPGLNYTWGQPAPPHLALAARASDAVRGCRFLGQAAPVEPPAAAASTANAEFLLAGPDQFHWNIV